MLFEEWEKGTGNRNYEEYKLAEVVYQQMPESFTKEKLYKLKEFMGDDFKALTEVFFNNIESNIRLREENAILGRRADFMYRAIDSYKQVQKIDIVSSYAIQRGEDAKLNTYQMVMDEWDNLYPTNPTEDGNQ